MAALENGTTGGDARVGIRRLTLRRRLQLFASVGVLFVVVVAIAGYSAFDEARSSNGAVVTMSAACSNHQDADMMHDAVRSDVYQALFLAPSRAAGFEEEVKRDLSANAAQLRNDMSANDALVLPAIADEALAAAREPLSRYLDEAATIVDLAFRDHPAAVARLDLFDRAFEDLKVELENLTQIFGDLTLRAAERSEATNARTELLLLSTVTLAIVLLVLLAWATTRSIVTALSRLAAVARQIARGELHARATDNTRDELGDLARAINGMAGDLQSLVQRMGVSAERDGFGAQLAEALEMADTEQDALQVLERAMSSISAGTPIEILLADSSKAHLSRAASNPTAAAPCWPGRVTVQLCGRTSGQSGDLRKFRGAQCLSETPRPGRRTDLGCLRTRDLHGPCPWRTARLRSGR